MPDRLIQLVALIVLAGGLLGSFLLTPTINQQRVDRQLTYSVDVGDDANPAYTVASSLGSFRGILINILWQRSEELKNEGKFFEANNLAEMITTLQPRYPEAWNFQGWNMAYNISVKCKTAEERWDWVQKGATLLQSRGIPNNPNAVVLYRSLAWIYGHKMNGQTDDMHWYYKARMAENWQTLLGVPDQRALAPLPADEQDVQTDTEPNNGRWIATEQFREIATAAQTYLQKPDRLDEDYKAANYFTTLSPDALARFYDDNPGLREVVAEIENIPGADGEPMGLGLNVRTLRALGRLKMFADAGYPTRSAAVNNPDTLGPDAQAIQAWIRSRQSNVVLNVIPGLLIDQAIARLKAERGPDAEIVDLVPMLSLLRAQALIADYHMDPLYMLACMERFGPLDWRHPASHSLYWTSLGSLRAEAWTQDKERVDLINANRSIIHSLQYLAHNGKISFRPRVKALGTLGQESINHTPDTRMIPAYAIAWQEVIDKLEAGELGKNSATKRDTYDNGHENFLQAAVYLYYFEGQEDLARKYFEQCIELYSQRDSSGIASRGEYNLSLRDFAIVRLEDDLNFQDVAMINYWIRFAWQRGLAERSQVVMARYLSAAKKRYDENQEERQTAVRGDVAAQARQALPPFEELVLVQFLELMNSPTYSLIQKSGIWQLGGPLLQGISKEYPLVFVAYAQMRPLIMRQYQTEGWDIEMSSAFPVPPGFAEWEQQNAEPQPSIPTPLRPNTNP